jgi:ferredoxin
MASADQRLSENVLGRFYVTSECIDCDICRSLAPAFFARHDEIGLSIVQLQPRTEADIALAEEAVDSCPADAIGNDGVAVGTAAQ